MRRVRGTPSALSPDFWEATAIWFRFRLSEDATSHVGLDAGRSSRPAVEPRTREGCCSRSPTPEVPSRRLGVPPAMAGRSEPKLLRVRNRAQCGVARHACRGADAGSSGRPPGPGQLAGPLAFAVGINGSCRLGRAGGAPDTRVTHAPAVDPGHRPPAAPAFCIPRATPTRDRGLQFHFDNLKKLRHNSF